MANLKQFDGQLTLSDLFFMRDIDIETLNNFFLETECWRPNFRRLKNSIPESPTWYKDKSIDQPLDSNAIDAIIYLRIEPHSPAILYRTNDMGTWWRLKTEADLNLQVDQHETINDVTLISYYNDGYYVKLASSGSSFSVVVMTKTDYDSGLNIQ